MTLPGWRRRLTLLTLQASVGVVALGTWELLSIRGILDPFFFSQPSAIAGRTARWIAEGYLWPHLWVTLVETVLSFLIGSAGGVAVGLALARVPWLAAAFDPYIRMLNALPRVVLAPIFLLWFGLGIASKVALGVTLVFFIVFFNTYHGVREVDPVILNNARMLKASERQLLRHVFLPSAMSWILSSLHTSVGFAIVGAVIGEYLASARGIGYVIAQAEGVFDSTGIFAGMTVLAVVVLGIDFAIHALERRLLRWQPRASESGSSPL
ncbi:ABC transporter permease [Limnochorda pilosa]|uniref:ABC transporter permease n=1 Tax=Limnochorda pilosa TaxID=1555112 RepID=A0A0K2SGG1_LIMPI|nr:ABC transporter permease [Limnochorda pilosa]